jgi:ADP-ribose pyrophosphatase YjhB (NUDIX family)
MVQRYTVFLNEKVVLICQDINFSENSPNEIQMDFTDKTSLIKAYKSFNSDTESLILRIKAHNNFAEACNTFNSMFTRIEAAGGIVRNERADYLFIKRLGVWDLPKGKLHKKEPIQHGALREVTEETGLSNLIITKQLPSTFHIYTDRKGKEVLKETYWFGMMCTENQKLVPQLEEDITEVRWFSQAELHIPIANTYASLRMLLKNYCNM